MNANSGNLNRHAKVHKGVQPFKCDQCSKAFFRKDDLVSHKLSHTNARSQKCPCCGRCFKRRHTLRAHMLSVHNIKDPSTIVNAATNETTHNVIASSGASSSQPPQQPQQQQQQMPPRQLTSEDAAPLVAPGSMSASMPAFPPFGTMAPSPPAFVNPVPMRAPLGQGVAQQRAGGQGVDASSSRPNAPPSRLQVTTIGHDDHVSCLSVLRCRMYHVMLCRTYHVMSCRTYHVMLCRTYHVTSCRM
jgi:hypothetical protein